MVKLLLKNTHSFPILRKFQYVFSKAYLGPCQTYMMANTALQISRKYIVNGSRPLTVFIIDVWQGSKNVSHLHMCLLLAFWK